jgi:hypothetical protein
MVRVNVEAEQMTEPLIVGIAAIAGHANHPSGRVIGHDDAPAAVLFIEQPRPSLASRLYIDFAEHVVRDDSGVRRVPACDENRRDPGDVGQSCSAEAHV